MELFCKKTVYCERNTVLTVKKADRAKDTGTASNTTYSTQTNCVPYCAGLYRIRLTCEGGNFEATGFVNVLDVPGRPRLLKPDEVYVTRDQKSHVSSSRK